MTTLTATFTIDETKHVPGTPDHLRQILISILARGVGPKHTETLTNGTTEEHWGYDSVEVV